MLLLGSGRKSSLLRTVFISVSSLSLAFAQTTTTTPPEIPVFEQTTVFFTNATAPEGLSNGCTAALLVEIACAPIVASFGTSSYIPPSALQQVCTSQCSGALQAFRASVAASCVGETFEYYEGEAPIPVAMLADMLAFSFDYVCLKEGEKWCNEHSADSAAFGDPEVPHPFGFDTPIPTVQPDPCHLCAIKRVQHLASSHLFNGPLLRELSIYESLTSSCGITGYPLGSTTPAYPTSTPVSPTTTNTGPSATPTCAGTTYSIRPQDDCNSIAKSQGIGTGWLLIDNNLPPYCYNFPTSGELCLINRCSTTTVAQNSTCADIAASRNVTEAQLKSWNPVLDGGCHNLAQMTGVELCVEVPGLDGPYTTPAPLPLPPTMILTPAPAPTNVAVGTNSTYCGKFHRAVLGEYCNMLVLQYSIPLTDFRFLNTAINDNCTNLFADESYCVKPVGDINTYFGRPGITSIMTPTHTLTDDAFTRSATATWTMPPKPPSTELPLAENTREDCYHYIDGDDILRADINGTFFTSHCHYLASAFGVALDEVEIWNPSIGNASLPDCTVSLGYRYCGRLYDEEPEAVVEKFPELPIREGAHPNCTLYQEIENGWTCAEILEAFSLTNADFFRLNTAVGAECAGLWPGYRYCVSDTPLVIDDGSGTTTSDGGPTTTTTPTAPGPTHSGQPENCNKWHVVVDGDSCPKLIALYSISSADFYAWNPAVDSQCINNFWLGSAYCVGISSAPPTTKTTTPVPTSTPTPPGPTHEGQPENCNKWHLVTTGDNCVTIMNLHGISSSNFYAWNPAVDSQCINNFWGGYAYCVGVGSGTPTGPLVPHITPPGPTHTGQPANCNGWHLAQPGDDCQTLIDVYFLTVSEFFAWNPAVNALCTENFWGTYAYCVSIVGHVTRSTIPPTATATPTGVPIPSPVHDNSIISGCTKFAKPNDGDWCALFAERNGVTVAQLGAWNAALGVDGSECGSMFWGGYYYCIGVSS